MQGLVRLGRAALTAAALTAGALAFTAAAQTQGKPKIALYIANDALKPDEKAFLTAKLLKPFTASGLYSIIDRSDIFTKKASAERIKQRDGSVNDKEIYKIGYEAGAKYICMVELTNAFGRWNIAARMVDVESAEIYLSQGETDIEGALDKADFSGAAQTIFNQIHGRNAGSGGAAAQNQQTPAQTYQPSAPPPARSVIDGSGILTDSRDGKRYQTVVIGGKRWMAQNLNYQPQAGQSWCYDNNNSNCDKYGRLYDWETAKTVCPTGFHLPSRQEWDDLATTVGGKNVAGKKLKARSGWNNNGNGTDDFGFSALPSGLRYYSKGSFNNAGNYGHWWTATESGSNLASRRYMYINNDYVDEGNYVKNDAFSVRCVED